MTEGYCVKCKKKVEMENPSEFLTSNNRKILKGICSICKTKVCKFVSGKIKEEVKDGR